MSTEMTAAKVSYFKLPRLQVVVLTREETPSDPFLLAASANLSTQW